MLVIMMHSHTHMVLFLPPLIHQNPRTNQNQRACHHRHRPWSWRGSWKQPPEIPPVLAIVHVCGRTLASVRFGSAAVRR